MRRFHQMRRWCFDNALVQQHYTHRSNIGELATFEHGVITNYSHPASLNPVTVAEIKEYYNGK